MRSVLSGNILALDLATALGWATNPPYEEPTFGTEVLPSTGDQVGPFIAHFHKWLREKIEIEKPVLIIYEQLALFKGTNPATVLKLNGLAAHCEWVGHVKGIPVRSANPSQIFKFFTGGGVKAKGKAKKEATVHAARRRGWKVRDDNQGDACAVWAWAVHCYAAPEHRARVEAGPLL